MFKLVVSVALVCITSNAVAGPVTAAPVLTYELLPGSTITPYSYSGPTGPTEPLTGTFQWVPEPDGIQSIYGFNAISLDFSSPSYRLTLDRSPLNDEASDTFLNSFTTYFGEVVDTVGLPIPVGYLSGTLGPGEYLGPTTQPIFLLYPELQLDFPNGATPPLFARLSFSAALVPEPSTLILAASGGLLTLACQRRRKFRGVRPTAGRRDTFHTLGDGTNHRSTATVGLAIVLLCSMSQGSRASVLTFNIDSTRSHITLSLETQDGTAVSTAQTPGSDTTTVSGTLSVDITSSTIQFLTTDNTQFALQAVAQSPLPGGSLGAAPAQYGLDIAISGVGGGVVAARNYLGDATSGVIPRSAGSFDASQISVDLVAGDTAYNLTLQGNPVVGSIGPGIPVLNSLAGGTVTSAGGQSTLTIPVLAIGTVGVGGETFVNVYAGQIVATAVVPEPATVILAALGTLTLLATRLRRRIQSPG